MKNCLPTHLNISIGNNHQVKKAGDQDKRHPDRKSWCVVNFCASTFWSPCWQSFPCCCWWPSGAPCPHYQRHLESAETIVVQQKEIMQSMLHCAQWGRVLTKCPGGTSCFMGFMPGGGLQICTKHRLTQIFPNTSFMQWEIPKKQNLVKCCMLWHVIPNKCMKNIVLMLTLLTFFHSMTKTKHQHQIHHLHR